METETKMMPWQLVVTFYGPTDMRGARYKVTSGSAGKGARFFHYDYSAADARLVAAAQYMAALGYAPDLYRLEHAAVHELGGRAYNFYSVTRTGVEL